ncbi:MAG: Trk family potassium uptake protein [Ruminococcaceae bacterium]|nr:Trk family potassium uptake protein [Oscillospiraceae bacterium]
MIKRKRAFALDPTKTVILSFALMILIGALLLTLPISSKSKEFTPFIDALFTATSANCVTELVVVDTASHWSVFGQVVILMLIQFGGLGLMTLLTIGMVVLGKRISLKNRLVIQATFNQENIGGMVKLVNAVIIITFVFETVGAILLTAGFYLTGIPFGGALYRGIFQSVSSFCNAGFDILGSKSLIPYSSNIFILTVIMVLIVSGGLGFPVWSELLINRKKYSGKTSIKKRLSGLSLHTKLTLTTTSVLILIGTLLFFVFEYDNPFTIGNDGIGQKWFSSLFQSVTLRTCGYASIDQGGLNETSKLLSCVLMYIGGSPSGTAGGIKTVTFALIIVSMISTLKGKNKTEVFRRSVKDGYLLRCLTVANTFLIVMLVSTYLLNAVERNNAFEHTLLDLLFEISSAMGTVGVTTGITPHLSNAGKLIVTSCMYIGRISPMALIIALNARYRSDFDTIRYPDEGLIIG